MFVITENIMKHPVLIFTKMRIPYYMHFHSYAVWHAIWCTDGLLIFAQKKAIFYRSNLASVKRQNKFWFYYTYVLAGVFILRHGLGGGFHLGLGGWGGSFSVPNGSLLPHSISHFCIKIIKFVVCFYVHYIYNHPHSSSDGSHVLIPSNLSVLSSTKIVS
jgi:hypothetical protein